jgi:hypothetical protein
MLKGENIITVYEYFKKYGARMSTGFIWLRMGYIGGLRRTRDFIRGGQYFGSPGHC